MNSEKLALLKEEVEKIFGRKILSATDCQYLSSDIYQLTEFKISLNTLRRVFNLMTSKYHPSVFTLDLLARYCGYTSYSDFDARKSYLPSNNNNKENNVFFNFLILLFKDFKIENDNDATYKHLIHEIISNLDQWPNVIDRFQCEVAKTVNGQKFYYEQFINIDKLSQFYAKGLHYYLREKKTADAQVFGHAILCFHGWLVMDHESLKQHYDEVIRYKADVTMDPFTCGRFFAAQLYAANTYNNAVEPILIQARVFYDKLKNSESNNGQVRGFEYVLAEALVMIHEYEEALFFLDAATQEKNNYTQAHIDLKLFESIRLFKAIALSNLGKTEKAKALLDKVSTRNFYFLSRLFHSILYLSQLQHFQKRMFVQKQLDHLVEQTGFRKLLLVEKEKISAS